MFRPIHLALATALAVPLPAQFLLGTVPVTTPNGGLSGLDPNGRELWFVDHGAGRVLGSLDPTTGQIAGSWDIATETRGAFGVTRVGRSLYVLDFLGREFDVYDLAGRFVRSVPMSTPIYAATGVVYHPPTGTLRVSDTTGRQVHAFDLAGNLQASYPLTAVGARGIAWDATDDSFWVFHQGSDTIRHYDAAFQELSSVPLPAPLDGWLGTGLALAGRDLYLAFSSPDVLAHFSLDTARAEATPFGAGCPLPRAWYEHFGSTPSDLAGRSVLVQHSARGMTVSEIRDAFEDQFARQVQFDATKLLEDEPLGFSTRFPGIGPVSTVDVDYHGRVGWDLAQSVFMANSANLLADRMIAVYWTLYNDNNGGDVYFDRFRNRAVITWDRFRHYTSGARSTFQIQFHANGDLVLSWRTTNYGGMVGLSAGGSPPDPGPLDLTAAMPFSRAADLPFRLSAASRPVLGTSLVLHASEFPATVGSALVVAGTGALALPVPALPPHCLIRTNNDLGLALPVSLSSGTVPAVPIPYDIRLLGARLYFQAAAIDPTLPDPVPVLTSNGLEAFFGNL